MNKSFLWKSSAVILIIFSIIAGLLWDVPRLPILNETIRNLYFHVTMWFSMMIILFVSLVYSIRFLSSNKLDHDIVAEEMSKTGVFFGVLGLLTGMLWAKFTWGVWWINDPKLNGVAVTMLIYLAYFVLRNSLSDELKRARLAAIYSIFAFVMLIVFLMILPRMTDSLHPGNGGNPAFSNYDLNNSMRLVFYPAIIGWTLLGVWIASLRIRIKRIKNTQNIT